MGYIEGYSRKQTLLFPEVLDDYVATENPVRFIDAYVDSLNLVEFGFTQSIPKEIGRPPYNPGDLLKLYIYGYLNHVRSSRNLEKSTHRNIELIWLLRKLRPDFKTIADFRRDNAKAIKQVCRNFTLLCKKLELFAGELIAIDSSDFKAVNSKSRNFSKKEIKNILKQINEKIDAYFVELNHQDQAEAGVSTPDAETLKAKIEKLQSRKEKFSNLKEQLETSGESQVSLTDPDSRCLKKAKKNIVGYKVQIVTDDKHKLIVTHEVTNDRTDNNQLAHMAITAKEILGVEELEAITDKGYYGGDEVKKCQDEDITCFIPKVQHSGNEKYGLFTKDDFIYDAQKDCYTCPAHEILSYRGTEIRREKEIRRYSTSACKTCTLRSKCTKSTENRRTIYRWVHEAVLEQMHERVLQNPEKLAKRKQLVEHPFGTIKTAMQQGYFLSKKLVNVSTEMSLTVLAYNLKRVINIVGVKELLNAIS